MKVFGHVGLTLAAAYAAERVLSRRRGAPAAWSGTDPGPASRSAMDYRAAILGSLLADIIDKPLGLWIAPGLVNHSLRTFGHSALFAILLLLAAWVLVRSAGSLAPIVLALGSAGHLVLDQMWRQTETVLWPLRGWAFPEVTTTVSAWTSSHWRDLMEFYREPPEVVGAVVIVLFAARLARPGGVVRFLRHGVAT